MGGMIVVFNAGSSSLKFCVYESANLQCVLQGEVECLLTEPHLWISTNGQKTTVKKPLTPDIADIFRVVREKIDKMLKGQSIVAIVHRVVHGGKKYTQPTVINDDVIIHLREFIPLAPLHQPYNLDVIYAAQLYYRGIPQIACFDTSFHRTQSDLAERFALPAHFAEEGVIRYGFHGLSYEYIASKLPAYVKEKAQQRIIVAHLGNGASLCAMKELKSVSTSMGFTALDGLMMGTRAGNIDPGILLYLLKEKGMSLGDLESLLYRESGLKGVSGISYDIRVLQESLDPRAAMAIDLFCYIAAKQIACLLPTIGGLDVLVFTAGIGEHSPEIRRRICTYFAWLGLTLDEKRNRDNGPQISAPDSKIDVYVIPTNEEAIMARDALKVLTSYNA